MNEKWCAILDREAVNSRMEKAEENLFAIAHTANTQTFIEHINSLYDFQISRHLTLFNDDPCLFYTLVVYIENVYLYVIFSIHDDDAFLA